MTPAAAAIPPPASEGLPKGAPRTAMVLAAGLGLRMRPLTLERPKPLIPVGGQSMLDHALDRLAAAGVELAVVNTHWLPDQIAARLKARRAEGRGPETVISHEPELLEVAGGIRNALPLLGDAPFYVVNADVVWLDGPVPALTRLARQWDPARMDALLLVCPTVLAVGYDDQRGDVAMDATGRLRFRRSQEVVPFVYAGVMITKPEPYAETPDGPFSNAVVWRRMADAGRLFGLRHDGPWYHVGTVAALADVDARLRQPLLRWAEP